MTDPEVTFGGRDVAILAAWMIAGYLIGSIPFGWIIGKMRGVDIREHGSKNIGATNCGRVCGWPYGVAAFVLDVSKGFFPVLAAVAGLHEMMALPQGFRCIHEMHGSAFAQVLFYDTVPIYRWLVTVLFALMPLLGHVFPVWLKFKGGKAVATALGVVLALPMLRWPALAAFALWCIVTAATRYVSVGSTAAAIALLAIYLCVEHAAALTDYLPVTVFVVLIVAMVIARHRSNYARLLKGTEHKLWGGKKAGEEPPPAEK
jgi:glycerol-3-phosphate acyltransferase PlsY